MTETPPEQDQQPPTGVAAENLRNYERLRRSTTDRKIAGVAGGLGRHLNIDPTVLRVLFVVLALFGGAGLVLYGVMWLVVPEEGSEHSVIHTTPTARNAILIVVGVLAALMLIGDSWDGVGFPWPLVLVAVVVLAFLLNRDREDAPAPSGPSGPGGPEDATTYAAPYRPRPPRAERGPKLFGPTLALLALALGGLGLYDASGEVIEAAYAALALAVVGAMLLVASVAGRGGGLIFLGIVAALALAITSTVDGNWHDERQIDTSPALASGVHDRYAITAGQIRLDLTDVQDVENLDGRRLALQAEAGEILVVVPDGVDVDVDASISFGGEIDVDGFVENGNDVDVNRRIEGGDDVPQIYLELDLVVGHIEVQKENAA